MGRFKSAGFDGIPDVGPPRCTRWRLSNSRNPPAKKTTARWSAKQRGVFNKIPHPTRTMGLQSALLLEKDVLSIRPPPPREHKKRAPTAGAPAPWYSVVRPLEERRQLFGLDAGPLVPSAGFGDGSSATRHRSVVIEAVEDGKGGRWDSGCVEMVEKTGWIRWHRRILLFWLIVYRAIVSGFCHLCRYPSLKPLSLFLRGLGPAPSKLAPAAGEAHVGVILKIGRPPGISRQVYFRPTICQHQV